MEKKKIIIVIFAVILIMVVGEAGTWWFIQSQNSKKNLYESGTHENKVSVRENIDIEIMSNLLLPEDFFEEVDKDNTLEINYYKDESTYTFIDKYNELGTYKVIIKFEGQEYESQLNVIDSTKPNLELQEVTIKENQTYGIKDFIKVCNDNSEKECILEYKENITYNNKGSYDITIIAKDESNNLAERNTKLIIEKKETNSRSSGKTNNSTSKKTITSPNNSTNHKSLENEKTFVETKKEVNTNDTFAEADANRSTYASFIDAVVTHTNEYRLEVRSSPLVLDESLTKAAMIRAIEIAYEDKFSHERPNGTSCFTIFDDLGIVSYVSGENIALGQISPEKVSNSWRNSPGHYANMINTRFTKIGVGVIKYNGNYYWVQLFSN